MNSPECVSAAETARCGFACVCARFHDCVPTCCCLGACLRACVRMCRPHRRALHVLQSSPQQVQYTSNAEYSETVSHLDHTEFISDKGMVWKLMRPFHVTPPTWLWEEERLIHPPRSHMDPDHFVEGSAARAALLPAWSLPAAVAARERAQQGDVPAPSSDDVANGGVGGGGGGGSKDSNGGDDDDDAPVLTPNTAHAAATAVAAVGRKGKETEERKEGEEEEADPVMAAVAALSEQQVLDGLRKDTVWFCKPAGRDYGGGMILGNSIEACLNSPDFDKQDTCVFCFWV